MRPLIQKSNESDGFSAKKSFFNHQTGNQAVVQTKLTVGSANDAHEHEANQTADMVMRKPENSVKNGTYTEGSLFSPTITPMVQRACAHCEAEKEQTAQRKETGAATGGFSAPPSVSKAIARGGSALDSNAKTFMESRFNRSFDNVQVHTDGESAASARDISARAYTSGNHIVFGDGQYQPNTEGGRHLLAHELTHVVQQGSAFQNIQRQAAPPAQPSNVSTPIVASASLRKGGGFTLVANGVTITVLPDTRTTHGTGAETSFHFANTHIAGPHLDAADNVTSFTPPSPLRVTIRTTYKGADNASTISGYGRGTTAADVASGNTTLRFHEGSHGSGFINFIQNNSLPVFGGTVGMSRADFNQAFADYNTELATFTANLQQDSLVNTDCVGTTIDQFNGTTVCP
jgi:hypothetical protein